MLFGYSPFATVTVTAASVEKEADGDTGGNSEWFVEKANIGPEGGANSGGEIVQKKSGEADKDHDDNDVEKTIKTVHVATTTQRKQEKTQPSGATQPNGAKTTQ